MQAGIEIAEYIRESGIHTVVGPPTYAHRSAWRSSPPVRTKWLSRHRRSASIQPRTYDAYTGQEGEASRNDIAYSLAT